MDEFSLVGVDSLGNHKCGGSNIAGVVFVGSVTFTVHYLGECSISLQ